MAIVDGGTRTESANSIMGREKPKMVVIMGPTGSGKSRLAIDLASYFPVEIINADSMQVYRGLDVLTNKVPPEDQNGQLVTSICMLFSPIVGKPVLPLVALDF